MAGLTDPKTGKAIPGSSSGNQSSSGITYISQANQGVGSGNPFYLPTYTDTTYVTQTSPQDIESLVNATMQSLVGRNATAQEIKLYGAELLSAEKANVGTYAGETTYAISGKRNTVTGTQTTAGVDVQGLLQNLISGSADAQSYKAATGYFDAMTQALQQQKAQ
jgi:hypothetical protein